MRGFGLSLRGIPFSFVHALALGALLAACDAENAKSSDITSLTGGARAEAEVAARAHPANAPTTAEASSRSSTPLDEAIVARFVDRLRAVGGDPSSAELERDPAELGCSPEALSSLREHARFALSVPILTELDRNLLVIEDQGFAASGILDVVKNQLQGFERFAESSGGQRGKNAAAELAAERAGFEAEQNRGAERLAQYKQARARVAALEPIQRENYRLVEIAMLDAGLIERVEGPARDRWLTGLLRSGDPSRAGRALDLLESDDASDALPWQALADALAIGDASVRHRTLDLLSRYEAEDGPPPGVERVVAVLADEDSIVRTSAKSVLSRWGEQTIPALLAVVAASEPPQLTFVEALVDAIEDAEHPPAQCRPAIERLLQSSDPTTVELARRVALKVGLKRPEIVREAFDRLRQGDLSEVGVITRLGPAARDHLDELLALAAGKNVLVQNQALSAIAGDDATLAAALPRLPPIFEQLDAFSAFNIGNQIRERVTDMPKLGAEARSAWSKIDARLKQNPMSIQTENIRKQAEALQKALGGLRKPEDKDK